MSSTIQSPSSVPLTTISRLHCKGNNKSRSVVNLRQGRISTPLITTKPLIVSCASTSPWEPPPVTYAANQEVKLLKEQNNIFEAMDTSSNTEAEVEASTSHQPFTKLKNLKKWPLWILGPALLLATGVVPTLWLPISSIFLGPNIASLLSLTGLDCIFNLGASLFLLMADSSARKNEDDPKREFNSSSPPEDYRFWNVIANVLGFTVPLAMFLCSYKGFLVGPHTPFICFMVVLGPYFLLLSVQLLTEMLTWHWRSPVWLVTPVVYEAYRLLQLMRGLRLGSELGSPAWVVHLVRGLVCGWVLVLGVQLMRVAWYAGFTAHSYLKESENENGASIQ